LGAVVLVVGSLVLAVLGGVFWAGADGRGTAAAIQSPRDPAGPPDSLRPGAGVSEQPWLPVLQQLDEQRSAAFAEADADRLSRVYAPGSPAWARDRSLVAQLRSSGHTALGVRLVPQSVEVVRATASEATLRITDVMPPYRLVGATGTSSTERPGRAAARWLVTLVRTSGEWRVFDVQRD
jgi:hypothetical protein